MSIHHKRSRRNAQKTVYCASPVSCFNWVAYGREVPHIKERYTRMLAHIKEHFPKASLLQPRFLFGSNAAWLVLWPLLQPQIDILVVFTDERGYIGKGVWVEVQDVLAAHKHAYYLDDMGALHPWNEVELSAPNEGNWRRYARVTIKRLKVGA